MQSKKPDQAARTRGRPVLSPKQIADMRRRISGLARDLFQAEGYAQVSMRRLAAAAECSPMTLYQYFPAGKIDILRGIWESVFNELFDDLEPLARGRAAPLELLRRMCAAYVAWWLARPDHYRVVFMAEGVTQPDVSVFLQDSPVMQRFGVLLSLLAEVLGSSLSAEAAKVRADLLISALNGIVHSQITISGFAWTEPEVLARAAVDAVAGTLA
jgi:AcrR family transcriptional regulator